MLIGGHFLVDSAVLLAGTLKIPQLVIGLVAVAFGTSLPEAFTAINSIIRKRLEMSAGNLFGASVLDLTIALGFGSVLDGAKFDSATLYFTIGAIAALSVIGLFAVSQKISLKLLGGISIIIYVVFVGIFASA